MHCRECGTPLTKTGAGRPRLYCSASCRQRAYRHRLHPTGVEGAKQLPTVATRLKDTVDRLWLHSLGWQPPETKSADSVFFQLLNETVRLTALVAEISGIPVHLPDHVDGNRDETI